MHDSLVVMVLLRYCYQPTNDQIVKEHDGYFPVKIEALPEGTAHHVHVPVYQITAEGEMSRLVTYLETLMTMLWVSVRRQTVLVSTTSCDHSYAFLTFVISTL